MNDEEKLKFNLINKRKTNRAIFKKKYINSSKLTTIIIIIILLFIFSVSYTFVLKMNDKTYKQTKRYFSVQNNNPYIREDEFFENYQKEIELKNEEFENNIINTNIIKNRLDEIKIIQENNTLIKNNTYMNLTESKDNYNEAINYINMIMNTSFSLENLKNFSIIKNPKISIIIPVHNSEMLLKPFIISIQNQAFKDIEIIYVDDFSTDNSTELIKSFQKKDQRIVLLKNKQKRGPFYSRNKGAIFSRGDYIQFIDSDDILVGNILEKAYNIAMDKKVDIVQYSVLKQKKQKLVYINERTHKNIIYQPELSDQMYYGGRILKQANLFLINKLIKKRTFYEGLISMGDDFLKEDLYMQEDTVTLFCLLRVANSLIIIDDIGYYYIFGKNPQSLMTKYGNPNFTNQIFHDNFIELKLIFNKTKNNERDKNICAQYFQMTFNLYNFLVPKVTKGFELIDEVLDLLLNCPFIMEFKKIRFREFKRRLSINKNKYNSNKKN